MNIAVLAEAGLKEEWLQKGTPADVTITWADSLRSLTVADADVYVDLLFRLDMERTHHLKKLLPRPVLINAVSYTTKTAGGDFIRLNAWPGMLQRPVTEIALPGAMSEETITEIFEKLQWKYQVVPDIAGMVTPRVLAMIINEAYYTLGDQVSTREAIDIAMKLGTNYPMGPFEWSEKIGLKRIGELLRVLAGTDRRYEVAPALEHELLKAEQHK